MPTDDDSAREPAKCLSCDEPAVSASTLWCETHSRKQRDDEARRLADMGEWAIETVLRYRDCHIQILDATIASLQAQLAEARVLNGNFERQARLNWERAVLMPVVESLALAETRAAGYRAALERIRDWRLGKLDEVTTEALAADPGLVLTAIRALWAVCMGIMGGDLDDAMQHEGFKVLGLKGHEDTEDDDACVEPTDT